MTFRLTSVSSSTASMLFASTQAQAQGTSISNDAHDSLFRTDASKFSKNFKCRTSVFDERSTFIGLAIAA